MNEFFTIKNETLISIADSIRAKNGVSDTYKPADMAAAIDAIQTGGSAAYNIAYGTTAPEDTSKLWVKTAEPNTVQIRSNPVTASGELNAGVTVLPLAAASVAAAAVGTKVYLFGGSADTGYLDTISIYNTKTNTVTALSEKLPVGTAGMAAASVGAKVYLFGGETASGKASAIYAFDTESGTLTTLGAALPAAMRYIAAAAVGTRVYLFGGQAEDAVDTILVFDTQSNTISDTGVVLPTVIFATAAAAVGAKVYLFGGMYFGLKSGSTYPYRLSTIQVFDTESYTLTTLSATLPIESNSMAAGVIGTKVYLFGGFEGVTFSYLSTILLFDTSTDTISTLSVSLPSAMMGIGIAAIGTKVYLFGGSNSSLKLSTIHEFVAELPLAENALLIELSLTDNLCELLPDAQIGIANVYCGNAEGMAEKVPAALYVSSAWVEL